MTAHGDPFAALYSAGFGTQPLPRHRGHHPGTKVQSVTPSMRRKSSSKLSFRGGTSLAIMSDARQPPGSRSRDTTIIPQEVLVPLWGSGPRWWGWGGCVRYVHDRV